MPGRLKVYQYDRQASDIPCGIELQNSDLIYIGYKYSVKLWNVALIRLNCRHTSMKRHFELYPVQTSSQVFAMPSRKMIQTLKACLQFEIANEGRPYGPADIKGSFFGLYKRGLLGINIKAQNKLRPSSWYVTTKGLLFLVSLSAKLT